jgi:SAM-dependent methyltransferase
MDPINQNIKADYDAIEYPGMAFAQTHPDRLAVLGVLAGISAPPVDRCRVLEVGCGIGANLFPMAEQIPGATFLGIDLSPRQIARGNEIVAELGFKNIELRCQDLMDFPADAGQFDYIIAHGLYAWVPGAVKSKLLEICRRHLSANGLAFISYSVLPGAYSTMIGRELMRYRARGIADDQQRVQVGKEILDFVVENTPYTEEYRQLLQETQKRVHEMSWRHIRHDELGAYSEPHYFRQFVAEAGRFNLAYVGDSDLTDLSLRVPENTRQILYSLSSDPIDREQYIDFLFNRRFRCSVLRQREALTDSAQSAQKLRSLLWVAGNPPESQTGTDPAGRPLCEFGTGADKVALVDTPPIEILRALRRAWPRGLPFEQLVDLAIAKSPVAHPRPMVANAIWQVIAFCFGMRVVELCTRDRNNIVADGAFPKVTKIARWQATHEAVVANLRHIGVNVNDLVRCLLPLMDGSHSRPELAAAMTAAKKRDPSIELPAEVLNPEGAQRYLDNVLRTMAENSLLVGE